MLSVVPMLTGMGPLFGGMAANVTARNNEANRLSRLFALEVGLPLAQRREPVHFRPVDEGALRGGDVFGLAAPSLLRRRLKRAAIGERELPRERPELVHRVEVRGCLLVRLAAGEERNAGHRRRHAGLEQPDGLLGDFLD